MLVVCDRVAFIFMSFHVAECGFGGGVAFCVFFVPFVLCEKMSLQDLILGVRYKGDYLLTKIADRLSRSVFKSSQKCVTMAPELPAASQRSC